VRERRDIDLILGQGMLAVGWTADTLNAPGKFLISTPEHTTPRRARAYRVDDQAVATIAARHAEHRPTLDLLSQRAIHGAEKAEQDAPADTNGSTDPADALWAAIGAGPPQGCSVKDLMVASGMGRSWVYSRLQAHATAGRVTQITRGRWVSADNTNGQMPR
jgi:S-DNA-T family DNA segregation ATPase FtsK/SpoIIIE